MAKRKMTNNDQQNIAHEPHGCEPRFYGRVRSFCSICDALHVTVKLHEHRRAHLWYLRFYYVSCCMWLFTLFQVERTSLHPKPEEQLSVVGGYFV